MIMGASVSLGYSIAVFVIITVIAWVLVFFIKLKNEVLRSPLAAIIAALLFQVANRIYVGFWDPFSTMAFVMSIPIAVCVCICLELLSNAIRR
jgi:hypothetical protein